MHANTMRRKAGFTLIELLVVVAIISLLVTILMPSLSRAKDMTRTVICETNLKTLGLAMELYAEDWGYYIPDDGGADPPFEEAYTNGDYIRMPPDKVWKDPSTTDLLCPVGREDGWQWRTRYLLNVHVRTWMGWGKGWEPKTADKFRNEVSPAKHVMAHDGRSTWGWDQPDGSNKLVCACLHYYVHGGGHFYDPDPAVRTSLCRLHPAGPEGEFGSPMLFNDQHVDLIPDLGSQSAYKDSPELDWWPKN